MFRNQAACKRLASTSFYRELLGKLLVQRWLVQVVVTFGYLICWWVYCIPNQEPLVNGSDLIFIAKFSSRLWSQVSFTVSSCVRYAVRCRCGLKDVKCCTQQDVLTHARTSSSSCKISLNHRQLNMFALHLPTQRCSTDNHLSSFFISPLSAVRQQSVHAGPLLYYCDCDKPICAST